MVVLGGVAVSYERDTPVLLDLPCSPLIRENVNIWTDHLDILAHTR